MRFSLFLALAALLTISSARADLLGELSADEQKQLASGEIIVHSKNVQGPWPQLKLYKIINAPQKVTWALLKDYSSAPSYTPNMISAKLLSDNSDGTKDIEYTVKMPILSKMSYSVKNTYTQTSKYNEVSWTLIKSPFAKVSDGSLRIESYPGNKTLICYTNLVVPFTSLVAGLKNQALSEAKATLQAIATEAEKRAGGGS